MRYNKGAVFAIASSALFSSVAIGATFAPSTLAAFTDTTASTANSAAAGTLNIDVVDGAGNASSAARVTVTNASPTTIKIPSSMLPSDGRFGCGPSKVRDAQLDALATETQRLERLYEQKQEALAALRKSLLHQAFSGEL